MFTTHYRECLGPRERGQKLGVKDKGLWDVHSPQQGVLPLSPWKVRNGAGIGSNR